MSGRARRRVMILGNCVAHRLQFLLEAHPVFSERYDLIPAPMIHALRDPAAWDDLARTALACDIILTQPLFHFGPCNTASLAAALEACAARDRGVDLGVAAFVARHYADTRLFESWRHPAPALLARMLGDLVTALDLPRDENHLALVHAHGFGFNQWPLLTAPHGLFRFPEQAFFRIGGRHVSLEDAAMAYYNFYEFHPHVVDRNPDKILGL